MADPWDRQNPPRLVGYESWLYQMPCIDSSGDLFVSVPRKRLVDYTIFVFRTASGD